MNSFAADMTLSRYLAEQILSVRLSALPSIVVGHARLLILDTLGVIAAAADASGIPELDRVLARSGGAGDATSLLGGWRGSPETAALINASAAHALDFDDQHDDGRVHVSCVSIPAALAAAEHRQNVSGARFIEAMVSGLELHCRLGLTFSHSVRSGWHPTTTFGHIAAAAAAARIFDLDAGRLTSALGIAYAQLSGSALSLREQSMTKRMGPGFAARSGVLSALMAAEGIAGPQRVFEDDAGLVQLYERGQANLAPLREGWGRAWHTGDISIKPYPCCRCSHSAIQLALELRAEGLRAEDVIDGTILLSSLNHGVVGSRYDPSTAPQADVHAQFNVAYSFAHALRCGPPGIDSFRAPAITAPGVVDLAQRLTAGIDPSIPPNALAPVRVQLRMRERGNIERYRSTVRGSPAEPMSEAEVIEKFRACLAMCAGRSEAAIQRVIEAAMALDRLEDVGVLSRLWLELAPRD